VSSEKVAKIKLLVAIVEIPEVKMRELKNNKK